VRRPLTSLVCAALAAAAVGMLVATCSSPGDSCQSDGDCSGDLVCAKPEVDGVQASTGVCTHRAAGQGEFCRVADDCAGGLFCSNELPSPSKRLDGTCIPLREDGDICANAEQCRPPLDCALAGDQQGICQPVPDAGIDAS
jgi:hypothetical protein